LAITNLKPSGSGRCPSTSRIGVRAQEITIASSADSTHCVPAEVYVVETLGHRNLVTARIGEHQVKVVTAPDFHLNVKDIVYLDIQSGRYYLFGDGLAFCHPVRADRGLAGGLSGG
jgi:ABC-type sugar transport system ATPase subunit